jgi:hypothetical protein
MIFQVPDRVLHYLLVGFGIGAGSFVKALWDKLAERFWDKEWKEFRKFKASLKKE